MKVTDVLNIMRNTHLKLMQIYQFLKSGTGFKPCYHLTITYKIYTQNGK